MKILLLGGNGQLGFELYRSLAVYGTVVVTTRDGALPSGVPVVAMDFSDLDALVALIEQERPNVIVNAVAYTKVDDAEKYPEAANHLNHLVPALLAKKARELGALLIHFSSDYVYSGDINRAWTERDVNEPRSAYGKSKLAGDQAIIASKCAHWIIRTQWLYAARGHNFMRTMLNRAKAGQAVRVVNDQFGAPTPVRLVATAVACMLSRWLSDLYEPSHHISARVAAGASSAAGLDSGNFARGIYHLSASESCSWFDFAECIFSEAQQMGLLDSKPELHAISTNDFVAAQTANGHTIAPRPRNSVLNCERLTRDFDLRLPDWRVLLRQTLHEYALLK